ncbi:hypothetical protein [Pseudoalteromonas denitrificans]|uniref:WD40-like Beta Propeller Repeat n=1 Tax=Pseudoalteromonas denitrificans DSM 6059 TaxID=1123010 RepID=A0A1I1SMU9_9GAMM|nr:hypothetical protein [Pseudoalteromonas denitrificans]SFD47721.1 WD40-like Beta Propeller Repeat [Pseudoalteromonas denitrificans DSM 6059]
MNYHFLPLVFILFFIGCGGDSLLNEDEQAPDPVVQQTPFAYVKRIGFSVDKMLMMEGASLAAFNPGAALFLQLNSSTNSPPINITDSAFTNGLSVEPYDVKDVETSHDGRFVIFAMRAPEIKDADEDEQPTWNIWQYEINSAALTRLIQSDLQAEQGHDTSPYYLPDGRVVFSSTRQSTNKATLLDEGKPQYQALDDQLKQKSSVLHIMDADGSNINQISFNQGNDFNPIVLSTGKILFTRWEQRGINSGMSLYQIDSDGKHLELVYGRHSHDQNDQQVQFIQPREMPDGRVLVGVKPIVQTTLSTNFVLINIQAYIDNLQAVDQNSGLTGPAQSNALFASSPLDENLSLQGQFNMATPLYDGSKRILMGWSQCRIIDPVLEGNYLPCTEELLLREGIESAPLLFGIWIYDPVTQTQRPLVLPEENSIYTEVVSLEQKPYPLSTQVPSDVALKSANQGLVHIRSVYDFSGQDMAEPDLVTVSNPMLSTRNERQAHFLRIIKPVSIPDSDEYPFTNAAFGRSRGQLMRDILGYVPIEPDGSVSFKMPADLAFSIEVLDQKGQRISQRHDSWLQLAPGEIRQCNGCHTAQNTLPHGLIDRGTPSINLGGAENSAFAGSDPDILAMAGETMAQAKSRIFGRQSLSADLNYVDIWSDPTQRTPDQAKDLTYADLNTAKPVSDECAQNWQNQCRITINFPTHIQTLFELPRPIFDTDGITEIEQNRCTSCHSNTNDDDELKIPAAQLDLRGQDSNENSQHSIAYRELLFNDNEQEIIDDILIDKLVPMLDADGNPVFETEENGDLILDTNGQPIPVMQTVSIQPSLSVAGAKSSPRFFNLFEPQGSHFDYLTPAELRLISEWLDIGAQYYNNPFDAPAN